jgi:hypothetical protein
MRTIKKAKNEVVLEKFTAGEVLELGNGWHDGRGECGTAWQKVTVVKDNKVTVDLELGNGDIVRFDKRGEINRTLKR